MQETLLLIQNELVVVQTSDEVYSDSYGNFLLDGGIKLPENINSIDYNKFRETCWINGEITDRYPFEYAENVLQLIDTLLTNQYNRRMEEINGKNDSFENRQIRALTQLNQDLETAKERAHIKSSLGFEVDANQTANENVNGLLVTTGDGTVQFCDYYNEFHELNKAQLQTLQAEIIANAQSLYAQKWQYRAAIEECTDNDQLDEVVEGIKFTYMDFTPQEAQEEPTGDGDQIAEQTE